MNKIFRTNGFTLIELLLVIAVIGVLATVVLVAINPQEIFRRTRDAQRKGAAHETSEAFRRYEAVRLAYPWTPQKGDPTCITNMAGSPNGPLPTKESLMGNVFQPCFVALLNSKEIMNRFAYSSVYITNVPPMPGGSWYVTEPIWGSLRVTQKSNRQLAVCFDPESKSESTAPETIYTEVGDPTCNPATSSSCYYCTLY